MFARNIERLKALLAGVDRRPARPRRLHLLDLGRRPRPDLRGAREGPAHRLGRVHRRRRSPTRSTARGDEVVAGRPDAAAGPRRGRRRPRAPTSSTCATPTAWADLLDGVDVVCHQAALVGRRGHAWPTCRRTPPTTTSAPPRCWPRCTTAGVDRLVLASSMVVYGEGRYACPEHGDQAAGAARPARPWTPGEFENHCPRLRRPARLGAGRRGRPARPAQRVRRQQGRPGALRVRLGPAGRRRRRSRCATTTSTARGCRGTRRTPGSPRCSARRSSAASRRGCSRTAARCATSCTSPTSRAPTCCAMRAVADAAAAGVRGVQRLLRARPVSIRRGGRAWWPRHGGGSSRWSTGEYRLGDVRHVVASPERAARRARLPRPRSRPRSGCRAFATRPAPRPDGVTSRCRAGAAPRSADDQLQRQARPPPALGQQRGARQQPRHERQPDPLHLGLAHPATGRRPRPRRSAAPHDQQRTTRVGTAVPADAPASAPARRRSSGPAQKAQRGEVAPQPVRRRARAARSRPSSAPAAPGRPPTSRSRTPRTPAPPPAPPAAAGTAAATSARRRAPPARAAPAAAGRRTSSRTQPSSSPATRTRPDATAAAGWPRERQAGQPPGRDRREHRVGRDRHPDRRRAEHQERRGAPRRRLGAQRAQGDQHRRARWSARRAR